ncbi:MAG: hypothetical protein KF724_02720 [Phycisphaeraceae bacterium]|nr:hypothetical protein [Phycisphaeraceae bacterium]
MITIDLDALRDAFDRHRRAILLGGTAALLALFIGGGTYWWVAIRWKPPPSIFDSPVDDALGYLALPDFNKLPVEERLKFLLELADRFRGLQPQESAAAAAFLAGVVGPARAQLHENARTLAKDVLAGAAAEYIDLPEEQRGPFIDKWVADWMRLGERMTRGEERPRSDDERLAEARRDIQRNRDRVAEDGGPPPPSDRIASRFMDFWQSEVEQASSPKEQGQIVRFMNDVRKRLTR